MKTQRSLLLIVSLILQTVSFSQSLIPYRNSSNKWGYCNKNMEIIVPCTFDNAYPVIDGLGKFVKDGKIGYINAKGVIVAEAKYDVGEIPNNGLALVKLNNKFGFLNSEGKEIIPLVYDRAYSFHKGFASVFMNDSCGVINTKGQIVVPIKYVFTNGGQPAFNEGIISMIKTPRPNISFVFVDNTGKELFGQSYSSADIFQNGRASVASIKNQRWGVINNKGNLVIPYEYDNFFRFNYGVAAVTKNKKNGLIDSLGNVLIPFEYDGLQVLGRNVYIVTKENSCYLVNSKGEKLNNEVYQKYKYTRDGITPIQKNDFWGYIDHTGKEITAFEYTYAECFNNGYGVLYLDEDRLIVDVKGQMVSLPDTYFSLDNENMNDGIICYSKDIKEEVRQVYGIKNLKGKGIEEKYSSITQNFIHSEYPSKYVIEGLIRVSTNPQGEIGYIDLDGNEYWEKTKNDIAYEERNERYRERRYANTQTLSTNTASNSNVNISFNKIYSEFRHIEGPNDVQEYRPIPGGKLNVLVGLKEINITTVFSRNLIDHFEVISSQNTVFEGAPAIGYLAKNKKTKTDCQFYFINELNTFFLVDNGTVTQFKGY